MKSSLIAEYSKRIINMDKSDLHLQNKRRATFIYNPWQINSADNKQSDIWFRKMQQCTTITTGNQHRASDCLTSELFQLPSKCFIIWLDNLGWRSLDQDIPPPSLPIVHIRIIMLLTEWRHWSKVCGVFMSCKLFVQITFLLLLKWNWSSVSTELELIYLRLLENWTGSLYCLFRTHFNFNNV